MSRLDDIRLKLAASLNAEGKPAKGFKNRVAAITAEIARLESLETARPVATMESVETPPGLSGS